MQIILTQNEKNFQVFINGIPEFSIEQMIDILNLSYCEQNFSRENSCNTEKLKIFFFKLFFSESIQNR